MTATEEMPEGGASPKDAMVAWADLRTISRNPALSEREREMLENAASILMALQSWTTNKSRRAAV